MIYQTTILATLALAALLIAVDKKYFLLPFILAACFIPADQRIIIMELDFTPLRILVVVGFLRVLFKSEKIAFRLHFFDKLVFTWIVTVALIYIIQWRDTRALIYQSGILFDVIGLYWLFRININYLDDIKLVIKIFAFCSLILAVLVGLEWVTGKNPFVMLGRVTTVIREERYRCQASFPHSIILGLFWATLVPLFVGLAKSGRGSKLLCWSATTASIFMVFSTASSTPLIGLSGVLFFLSLFRYRRYGRQAVWGILAALCALHIVMEAPVWHLIARIDLVGGSTGYHRYKLINEAIRHFHEWVLIGTRSTAHWGWGQQDVTNQYVAEGVTGGLLGLVLFIAVLVLAVKSVGKYSLTASSRQEQWLGWGLCVSLLGHCISFFGVTYFGQIRMLLFLMFAMSGWIYETLETKKFALIAARPATVSEGTDGCICCHS